KHWEPAFNQKIAAQESVVVEYPEGIHFLFYDEQVEGVLDLFGTWCVGDDNRDQFDLFDFSELHLSVDHASECLAVNHSDACDFEFSDFTKGHDATDGGYFIDDACRAA